MEEGLMLAVYVAHEVLGALGRLRMASSFIISAQADCTEGNSVKARLSSGYPAP